jgi:predicted GNAT superfamily acetyltransferase
MAVDTSNIVVRKCDDIAEFQACVALQKEVWNFSDTDLIPLRLFVVAKKIGGQIIGSFDGEELVGFALSIPGSRGGHAYLHSHMLAVRDKYRNVGLGRQMKLLQREDAIAHGFELIEWTFDPLEIKNAFLNLARLGAVARRYNINQYGFSSSPLQGGLPTDRLVAEWWLKSKRVEQLVATGSVPNIKPETTVEVPAQIYEWKAAEKDRDRAKRLQLCNREQFLAAFRQGLAALGYECDKEGNGRFLLARWDESFEYAGAHDEDEQ